MRCSCRAVVTEVVARRSGAAEDRYRLASITHCAAGLNAVVLVHEVWGNRNLGIAVLDIMGAAIVVLWSWSPVVRERAR